ncbi:MAG: hypothetical protein ABWZ57_13330 [Mesorhizobium sp.]
MLKLRMRPLPGRGLRGGQRLGAFSSMRAVEIPRIEGSRAARR